MFYVLKPLLRQPLMPILMALQVALAYAISCNALFLLQEKLAPIVAPLGVRDASSVVLLSNIAIKGAAPTPGEIRSVEASLRTVSGVSDVTYGATLPMVSSATISQKLRGASFNTTANAAVYVGDNLVDTLGLRLVSGRDFTTNERTRALGADMGMSVGGPVIVTRDLARKLFPSGNALGSLVYDRGPRSQGKIVVGIVSHLMQTKLDGGGGSAGYAMLVPGIPSNWPVPAFAVRTQALDSAAICNRLTAVVHRVLGPQLFPDDRVECQNYLRLRYHILAPQRAAVWLLSAVALIVLVVAMAGIFGMSGDWVAQHIRSIGIRRALGARRRDIVRELLVENLFIVGTGVLVGLVATYGINLWLMQRFAQPRLPWVYLPFGAVLLLALGQIAALVPARHAAHVSPSVATRNL